MSVLIFKNKDWRPHAPIKYGFKIMLSSVSTNNPELIHKPYTNSTLYIHGSSIGPEIIMRTGLRPQGTDKIINRGNYMNFGWGGVEKHGEKRIYLSSIGKWEEVNNNTTTEQLANIIINNMNNGYNKYCYLIKLPNNKGIRHDPEAAYDMDWVYTLNKIPPKYILYLGIEGIDFTTDEVYEKELAVSKQDIIDFITK